MHQYIHRNIFDVSLRDLSIACSMRDMIFDFTKKFHILFFVLHDNVFREYGIIIILLQAANCD